MHAGIVIALCPAAAELAAAQTAPTSGTLPQIDVNAPRRKPPARRAQTQTATQAEPATAPSPGAGDQTIVATPLDTNTVADSATRLGLTVREMPATVEVADQKVLQERGVHTTTEAAKAFVGVTGGDAPGAPASYSMRGFTGSQINTMYNGIWIGPSDMTGRIMDTGNLQRIEVLKGPDSLISGVGGIGGTVNYVTKMPHTGKVENETFATYDSWHGYRYGFGSGGSTPIKGLDYRFDVTRSNNVSFIDDTYSKLLGLSGRLNYRPTADVMFWAAVAQAP